MSNATIFLIITVPAQDIRPGDEWRDGERQLHWTALAAPTEDAEALYDLRLPVTFRDGGQGYRWFPRDFGVTVQRPVEG